jgi:uncharacterized protein (TIGR00288 family)
MLEFANKYGRVIIRKIYLTNVNKALIKSAQETGYELVLVPFSKRKPNHVDIHMIVDLMDHGLQEFIQTIIVASGDGDFEPAIRKLREKGKNVLVVAAEGSVNRVLKASADHFKSYKELMVQKP